MFSPERNYGISMCQVTILSRLKSKVDEVKAKIQAVKSLPVS